MHRLLVLALARSLLQTILCSYLVIDTFSSMKSTPVTLIVFFSKLGVFAQQVCKENSCIVDEADAQAAAKTRELMLNGI